MKQSYLMLQKLSGLKAFNLMAVHSFETGLVKKRTSGVLPFLA